MSNAIENLQKGLKGGGLDPIRFDEAIDALAVQITDAKVEVASLGNCDEEKKKKIRQTIKKYEEDLLALKRNKGNTSTSRKAAEAQAEKLTKELSQKMETIR